MKNLSSAGIAISVVSSFLFLALVAQVYYLLWWKKKRTAKRQVLEEEEEEAEEESVISPGKELLYLFCWKKPSSLSSTALNPQERCNNNNNPDGSMELHSNSGKDVIIPFGEEGIEAELMRLHSLSGPPRFLFTIKEETKEDLESDDGRSKGKSLSDMLADHTPYLTPLSSPPFFTPPLTPIDYCNQQGFNPLFESFKADSDLSRMKSSSSPPPKFKFLRDAEEKLYKKILTEEAMRVHKCSPCATPTSSSSPTKGLEDSDDGSFITIIIGKNHPNSSQVNPLSSSPPPIIRPAHGKP